MIFGFGFDPDQLSALPHDVQSRLLSEAATSSIRGYHLLVCSRSLARWIEENVDLPQYARAHYRRLGQEYGQFGGLLTPEVPHALVYIGNQFEYKPAKNEWLIGHQRIVSGRFLECAKFVVEDQGSDGELLRELLTMHANSLQMPVIHFDLVNGGGAGTSERLRYCIDHNYVTVCVCDHDRLSPFSSASPTCLKVIAESQKRPFVGAAYELPARELENLIPLDVIERVVRGKLPASTARLRELMRGQGNAAAGDCLWLYFDVKTGVDGERFKRECIDARAVGWVIGKYSLESWDDIENVRFDGFGANITPIVLETPAALAEMHRFVRGGYWRTHFSSFASAVCWWLAGRRPERV